MARRYVNEMDKENKSLNLASAPRSTEIVLSHGHATSNAEQDGTVVPNTEVDLADGQNELSIQDTSDSSTKTYVCTVDGMDVSPVLLLESISVSAPRRGASNGQGSDDSSDVGSLGVQEVLVDLRDGDLASCGSATRSLSFK